MIPADHKWFRNLAVSQIIADTMADLGLAFPAPSVNLADIRRKYHAAVKASEGGKKQKVARRLTGDAPPIRPERTNSGFSRSLLDRPNKTKYAGTAPQDREGWGFFWTEAWAPRSRRRPARQ